MQPHNNIQDLIDSAEKPFSIIEEFAALNPKRKMLLCEHLFSGSLSTFQNTVKLLWSEAGPQDIKKLERFLLVLKRASH